MEYNAINKEVRNISFFQIIKYIFEHILLVMLVGVVMAMVMAGFKYYSMKQPINTSEAYQTIIDKNKTASNPPSGTTGYSSERETIEGSCVVKSQLYIDYNYSNIEYSDNMDYNSIMNRFQNDVVNRMFSGETLVEVADEINTKYYNEIEQIDADDLRYMLNWTLGSANTFAFSVTDINIDRAKDIAELINYKFVEEGSQLDNIDSVKVLEEPSVYYNTINRVGKVSVPTLIEASLLGFFLGIFIMCGVYICIYVAVYSVRGDDELRVLNTQLFGYVSKDKSNHEVEYKRIAYNLSVLDDTKRVLFVPIDNNVDIGDMRECISEKIHQIKSEIDVVFTNDILSSPEVVVDINNSDGVVFVAKYGKTLMRDLQFAINDVRKLNKKIIGVVINNCR